MLYMLYHHLKQPKNLTEIISPVCIPTHQSLWGFFFLMCRYPRGLEECVDCVTV